MISRRNLLVSGAAGAVSLPALAETLVDLKLPGGPSTRPLSSAFPQKREMIVQRVRPPLLETPFEVFDQGVFTPNDRFFVRWHWDIPTAIDTKAYRLALRGAVKTPLSLSLNQVLRAGDPVEFAAVNQCAGNARGLFEPRIPGAQWGQGAMGNALWRGVPLKTLLEKAGLAADAKFVRFKGLDTPLVDGAPQYMKSLPIDIALRDETIVAFAMNGAALPLLNGYPLRLVVPGWFSTYWVKMLSDIEVLAAEDDNFWMAKAYRMPTVPVKPGDKDFPTVPITTMVPRAWITSHDDGARLPAKRPVSLRGIAMGGDCGVAKVEVVASGSVVQARLDTDQGQYGFRRWSVTLPQPASEIGVRCTNAKGVAQPLTQGWNPSGYARGVVETIRIEPL